MRHHRAFSLLEAIAVLLILSALGAISIGTARTLTAQTQVRQAESSIQRAIAAQRAHAASNGRWAKADETPPLLGLIMTEQVSIGPGEVSIAEGPEQTLGLAVHSLDGTCITYILEDPLDTAEASRVTLGERSPCSGGGALDARYGESSASAP